MAASDNKSPAAPLVAVAVLNWRARDQTLRCLKALGALDYSNFVVVLVDNGCNDFNDHRLAPAVELIRSEHNRGFAGGCNLALERAVELGAEYVWFLNNDALPEPSSLQWLVDAATNHRAGIVGPKVVRAGTDPPRLDSLAVSFDRFSGRFRLVGHDQIDNGQYDDAGEVDAVTGCAMLVRSDLARGLEGFDERYFLYLEDIDFCLRARDRGESVRTEPAARVLHERPASRSGRQSVDSLYYTSRNHFLLCATHGRGGRLRRLARVAAVLVLNLGYAVLGEPTHALPRLTAVVAGARDYARGRFGARVTRSSP